MLFVTPFNYNYLTLIFFLIILLFICVIFKTKKYQFIFKFFENLRINSRYKISSARLLDSLAIKGPFLRINNNKRFFSSEQKNKNKQFLKSWVMSLKKYWSIIEVKIFIISFLFLSFMLVFLLYLAALLHYCIQWHDFDILSDCNTEFLDSLVDFFKIGQTIELSGQLLSFIIFLLIFFIFYFFFIPIWFENFKKYIEKDSQFADWKWPPSLYERFIMFLVDYFFVSPKGFDRLFIFWCIWLIILLVWQL